MRLATLRRLIRDVVTSVTVPASAQWAGVTTIRHVDTMSLDVTGLDGAHLTCIVEHRGSLHPTRNRPPDLATSRYDVVLQVAARVGTLDGQTDSDAGLDAVDAVRDALCTAVTDGSEHVPIRVESIESVGLASSGDRYIYRMVVAAVHESEG